MDDPNYSDLFLGKIWGLLPKIFNLWWIISASPTHYKHLANLCQTIHTRFPVGCKKVHFSSLAAICSLHQLKKHGSHDRWIINGIYRISIKMDISNHAPPTSDEWYLYLVKFSSGVHFPTCHSLSHETKKKFTNLDDTLCSFPRVLWNSVTLLPCRCHSQLLGWL